MLKNLVTSENVKGLFNGPSISALTKESYHNAWNDTSFTSKPWNKWQGLYDQMMDKFTNYPYTC